MYKVGLDVEPGEYKISAVVTTGYYEVSDSCKHSIQSIIESDNFVGEKLLTLKKGQYIKLINSNLIMK
jgi:hypothetical protein